MTLAMVLQSNKPQHTSLVTASFNRALFSPFVVKWWEKQVSVDGILAPFFFLFLILLIIYDHFLNTYYTVVKLRNK